MKKILFLIALMPAIVFAQQDQRMHDFDFWIGEWTVYITGTENIAGHSKIESINDGMAIRETYTTGTAAKSYKGTSLNNYNKLSGKWEQYWTDNTGLVLYISGGLKDGSMVMDDVLYHFDDSVHNRLSWTPGADGTVRQVWEQSYDEGFSWSVIFDGTYRKK